MRRLLMIHPESSYATAVSISTNELVLEPVRILNGEWCVRRDGRLVPAAADDDDAFVLHDRSVDDGAALWPKLSHFLRDRGVFVPGDRTVLGDAERAGHWGRIAVPVEPWRGDGCDSGVAATVARGIQQMETA